MIPAFLQNADLLFLSKEDQNKVGYAALAVTATDKLVPLCEAFLANKYHLEDISGLVTADGAVSVYHFAHFDKPGRITVMAMAPLATPTFPSIAAVYQGAEWHERETRDFFGFQYEGNPNFIPLLLAEDMVDMHPLLKEEAALATLAGIFSAEGRVREIVKQADGFTLFDVPVKEEAPAPAEPPVEAPASEAATPPVSKTEKAQEPEKAPEAEKPAAAKAEKAAPEAKPEPKPEPKPKAPAKAAPKPAPAKAASTKGAVKSAKEGADND